MKLIVKSLPMFWLKEKMGVKPNTIRTMLSAGDKVEIVNTVSGESFERTIMDVSYYEGQMIISWDYMEVQKPKPTKKQVSGKEDKK